MKSINISSANLAPDVECPSSKSYSNRALILAALEPNDVTIENLADCDDTRHLVSALRELGLKLVDERGSFVVKGRVEDILETPRGAIHLGEGGTTIRFFIALVATMSVPVEIEVHPDFLKRPIQEYLDLLRGLGAKIELDGNKLSVQGPIRQGERIEVECSRTTQFASALELISKSSKLNVVPVNISASKSYLDMTKAVMDEFSKGLTYKVPVDYSSLGYFAAYACLSEKVTIRNANSKDHFQADSKVLDIIKEMGARFEFNHQGLSVWPISEFNEVNVDGSECLDLVPTLMFLMAYSGKKHCIKNIKNLRFKECDRLEEMLRIMELFGIDYSYDECKDELEITGSSPSKRPFGRIEVARDHRMVMVAAMFLKINGGGEIAPADAVEKSFPTFFNYF